MNLRGLFPKFSTHPTIRHKRISRQLTNGKLPIDIKVSPKVNESRYKECGGNTTLFYRTKSIPKNIDKT